MLAAQLGVGAYRRARIGLLGGSFNPAHEGHLHISREALKRLDLDEVWWLVSPQNPLKQRAGMAPLADRLKRARALVAGEKRLRVTDLETRLGTYYTVDTLRALRRRLPRLQFVWLMGADNLLQLAQWNNWPEIFDLVPIAVFDRPPYSARAALAKAARRFAFARTSPAALLGHTPSWCLIRGKLNPTSATAIRSGREAPLNHATKKVTP